MLAAKDLGFSYGGHVVLAGVSLQLERGAIVGLIGPNGVGKTTLLKLLAGLLEGDGVIEYDGVDLRRLSVRARAARRAYVAQEAAAPFPYRVAEVVAMGRAFTTATFAAPGSPAAVREALAEVGIGELYDRRFDELSGGERQLVLVARALLQSTDIVILDEPASHLDLRHRAHIIAALARRARAGVAVIASMHDLSLAGIACDRILLLAERQLVADGRPSEVLTAERLSAVFGVPLCAGRHPLSGTPTVELDPRAWA
jgi:iron complex transport system ATP-binding protein